LAAKLCPDPLRKLKHPSRYLAMTAEGVGIEKWERKRKGEEIRKK